jgi:hypothetical protein
MSTQNSRRVIRAGDLAQYKYCARAWWLGSVMGAPSANARELHRGEVAHRQHGRRVWASRVLMATAVIMALIAVLVLIAPTR